MKISYYAKNLMPYTRNKEWLFSDIELTHKLNYYLHIVGSYTSLIAGKSMIKYLGSPFYYDNPATPLNLQNYPHEIGTKILRYMRRNPKTVLDIGGNIGQFSKTLSYMLNDKVKIDIFEPNPEVYTILNKNISYSPNIRTFNLGIADKRGSIPFYFERGRSGTGSVFKANATNTGARTSKIMVDLTNNIPKTTGCHEYDLIKIDVEGYEYHVIKALKGVRTKWLFIEASAGGRKKDYRYSELLKAIRSNFGEYEVLYASSIDATHPTFDMLLEFETGLAK